MAQTETAGLDFETTGQYLDADARNVRTDDPVEKAALAAVHEIATHKVFADTAKLQVTIHADTDEITVSVADVSGAEKA